MNTRKSLILFVATLVLTAVALTSVRTHAAWRRIPASRCTWNANARMSADGGKVDHTPKPSQIICPVDSLEVSQANSYHNFNLHYFDSSTTRATRAQPCVQFFDSIGTACAGYFQPDQISATGVLALEYPHFTTWETHWAHFAFVDIRLPDSSCTGCFNYLMMTYLF